jgi:hypothetical protein
MILCYVSDIMLLIGYIMNYVCSLLAVCIKWFFFFADFYRFKVLTIPGLYVNDF